MLYQPDSSTSNSSGVVQGSLEGGIPRCKILEDAKLQFGVGGKLRGGTRNFICVSLLCKKGLSVLMQNNSIRVDRNKTRPYSSINTVLCALSGTGQNHIIIL